MRQLALGIMVLAVGCDDGAATRAPGEDMAPLRDARVVRDAAPAEVDAARPDAARPDAARPDAALVEDAATARDAALALDAAPPRDAAPVADAAAQDALAPVDAAPPPPEEQVRFAVLGDVGKGNNGQHRVGAALAGVCAEAGGCDFALLLGDNIYDAGAEDADDPQWQAKFEAPYADVDFPFYATLGNHDYGAPEILQSFGGGLGIDPTRGQAQLDYARRSEKFRLPDLFYRFEAGPVELVGLNTAAMFWRDLEIVELLTGFNLVNANQEATLPRWAEASQAPWRVAFGHHPYLSNGRHGNAGAYDGVFLEGLVGSGTSIRDFFEDYVIGEFDVLFSGHDHSLQDLGRVQGTNLIVSGAGASTTDVEDGRNDFVFQASEIGFVLVTADAQRMTFDFYLVAEDAEAAMPWRLAHSRTIRH